MMAGDEATGGGTPSGPSVYCDDCGGFYLLLDCVRRNRRRVVICCPNEDCDAVWLEYEIRPPIAESVVVNGKEVPSFLVK